MTDQTLETRDGGGPVGHLHARADHPVRSPRMERELRRRGHECSNRCVVRPDVERHYDRYGDLIAARLARWERLALSGWVLAAAGGVLFEGLTLFH